MARTGDVMRAYRGVRRKLNERLARARKAGKLAEELGKIEQDAMRWWKAGESKAKPRRRRIAQ